MRSSQRGGLILIDLYKIKIINMENKELVFTVMVTSSDLLKEEIKRYNKLLKTDFEIIETIEEIEVFFCTIKAMNSKIEDVFNLGFSLALFEEELRKKGEIDW
jgi:hypothetical protein